MMGGSGDSSLKAPSRTKREEVCGVGTPAVSSVGSGSYFTTAPSAPAHTSSLLNHHRRVVRSVGPRRPAEIQVTPPLSTATYCGYSYAWVARLAAV
jgi:hypothetical protein